VGESQRHHSPGERSAEAEARAISLREKDLPAAPSLGRWGHGTSRVPTHALGPPGETHADPGRTLYKYQPYLEKRFALTKSEYGIAPIFLKKPVRVIGLMHVYFLAIMLSALLEREVRRAMAARSLAKIPVLPEGRATATPTTPRILENFSDVAWQSFQEADRVLNFPVQLNETLRLLLDLAGVPSTLYR